jgi:hypothetical protein
MDTLGEHLVSPWKESSSSRFGPGDEFGDRKASADPTKNGELRAVSSRNHNPSSLPRPFLSVFPTGGRAQVFLGRERSRSIFGAAYMRVCICMGVVAVGS